VVPIIHHTNPGIPKDLGGVVLGVYEFRNKYHRGDDAEKHGACSAELQFPVLPDSQRKPGRTLLERYRRQP
jgi:hypothetical protein